MIASFQLLWTNLLPVFFEGKKSRKGVGSSWVLFFAKMRKFGQKTWNTNPLCLSVDLLLLFGSHRIHVVLFIPPLQMTGSIDRTWLETYEQKSLHDSNSPNPPYYQITSNEQMSKILSLHSLASSGNLWTFLGLRWSTSLSTTRRDWKQNRATMMPQGAGWYGWIVHLPVSTQWPSAFAGCGMWQECPSKT